MRIDIETQLDREFETLLSDLLHDLAADAGAPFDEREIALKAREDDGTLVGGMIVQPERGWLYVKYLALKPSARGEGIGQALLIRAEELATEMSLVGVYLDTFEFEAPSFYAKCGYVELARLPKFDNTKQKYWFYKICGEDRRIDNE